MYVLFQAEDGIRDGHVTGVQTCALPISLYLNIFRGVRAISEFDWPFTPIHSSSDGFSTPGGSGLQCLLRHLHPGHGYITRFRVCPVLLYALIRLAFATAPPLSGLTSQARCNS